MQVHEKGRKVAIHCVFFQRFVAPEGRKVGSLKRLVRSHVAKWEIRRICQLLWREARFQVKSVKYWRVWSTFSHSDVVFAWQAQGIIHLVKSEEKAL